MPPGPRHNTYSYSGLGSDAAKPGVEGRNRGGHIAVQVM